jgi:ABC-type multidrug transport system fused ATPase/permease subunit
VTLGALLTVFVNLVGGMIVALIFGWKLGLVATCCVPFLVFAGFFRIAIVSYFAEKARGSYEKSAQVACEAVSAIHTVQSLTREDEVQAKYDAILTIPLRDGIKSAWTNTVLYAASQSMNFLVNALVFWYGGNLIAYEGYGIQQFFTVFIAVVFGSMGAGRIFAYAPDLKKAKDAGEGVLNLLDRVPRNKASGNKMITIEKGDVTFTDVKFSYPLRPHVKVLKGLNLSIKSGQFAELVGSSGCGKSTSIGLIERFYDIKSGIISIDGHDITSFNTENLREQIGLVSQEPNLFDMSIRENIGFGCKVPPTLEEVENAAKAANIHDVHLLYLHSLTRSL